MSFCDGNEFSPILLSLARGGGARRCVLLLEIFVNQFLLTSAVAFNTFSYGATIFNRLFITNRRMLLKVAIKHFRELACQNA